MNLAYMCVVQNCREVGEMSGVATCHKNLCIQHLESYKKAFWKHYGVGVANTIIGDEQTPITTFFMDWKNQTEAEERNHGNAES